MVDPGIFAKLLNKEEFVKEFQSANIDSEAIEKEWKKIEQIFVLFYLQVAYDSLSESDKTGLVLKLTPNSTQTEIQSFASRMTKFLQSNPDAVDKVTVAKKAAEETFKQYRLSLEGGAI